MEDGDVEVVAAVITAGYDYTGIEPKVTVDLLVNSLADALVDKPDVLDNALLLAKQGKVFIRVVFNTEVFIRDVAADKVSLPQATFILGRVKRQLSSEFLRHQSSYDPTE